MCRAEGGPAGICGGHKAARGRPGAGRERGWCKAGDARGALAACAASQGAPGHLQLRARWKDCICIHTTSLKAFALPEFAHWCFVTVFSAGSQLLCRFVAVQRRRLCAHPHIVPVPGLGARGRCFPGHMSILGDSGGHLPSPPPGSISGAAPEAPSLGRGWLCVGGV